MKNVTILDGGMGQELIKRTSRKLTPLWSADVMLHEPNLVRDVHAEFINNGAEVITLNTYTATPQRLTRDGSIELLKPLHGAAIKAAQEAITTSGKAETKILKVALRFATPGGFSCRTRADNPTKSD